MNRSMLWILPLAGCLNLDGFVHNPVHCSTVGPETCETDNVWDAVCVPCEQPYAWDLDYPWFEGQLEPGQSIRAIDVLSVVQATLETNDGLGQLDTYFVPSHRGDPALAEITLLFSHGNYASVEHYMPRVRLMHEAGYNVLVWDYRGYGKSMPESAPSADQFLADARLVREYVDTVAPDADRIIPYANSLGSIPTIEAAAHRQPCALFLEAPFVSLGETALGNTTQSFGEGFFSDGQFDNVKNIGRVDAPTLVMVGELDNKFTPEQTRKLFDAAPSPKRFWVVADTKHGIGNRGVPEAGYAAWVAQMRSFLEEEAPACLTP
jgi:alpha-beta hydrolase superfamily lysophospholipase